MTDQADCEELQRELSQVPPGSNLHGMRVIKKIGDGGFAKVFLCETSGHQQVAIKRWALAHMTPDLLTLFQREVECIRRCNHPNVVKFYEAFYQPLCIAMEYVQGRSLFSLLHHHSRKYDWSFVRQAGYEMACAVEHVHNQGILHRDLKSSNFLLDMQNHIKLCDFGLGRVLRPDERPTGGRGTPYWMAPEVIAHNAYSGPADIYSYGIVLWELCARATPYDDHPDRDDVMKIVTAVLQQGLRPVMPAGVPAPVDALIRRCWDADPRNRPTWKEIKEFWRASTCIPPEQLHQVVVPLAQQRAAAAAAAAGYGGVAHPAPHQPMQM